MPYFAQPLVTSISNVIFLARVEGNPTSITVQADDVDLALNRIDVWQMCNGESSAMNLDTQFKLNIAETDQGKLLELLMVVKYEFGA